MNEVEIVCKKCDYSTLAKCIHPKKREMIGRVGIHYGNLIYCPYYKLRSIKGEE